MKIENLTIKAGIKKEYGYGINSYSVFDGASGWYDEIDCPEYLSEKKTFKYCFPVNLVVDKKPEMSGLRYVDRETYLHLKRMKGKQFPDFNCCVE